eukprot:5729942-Pleurochrysis_carterae.AAC.1
MAAQALLPLRRRLVSTALPTLIFLLLHVRRAAAVCADTNSDCPSWARQGECEKNPGYMLDACRASCGQCEKRGSSSSRAALADFMKDGQYTMHAGVTQGGVNLRITRCVGLIHSFAELGPLHMQLNAK